MFVVATNHQNETLSTRCAHISIVRSRHTHCSGMRNAKGDDVIIYNEWTNNHPAFLLSRFFPLYLCYRKSRTRFMFVAMAVMAANVTPRSSVVIRRVQLLVKSPPVRYVFGIWWLFVCHLPLVVCLTIVPLFHKINYYHLRKAWALKDINIVCLYLLSVLSPETSWKLLLSFIV